MRSDRSTDPRLTACLASRVQADSSAHEIAVACGGLWQELDAALSPIIGPRGVAALGQRSLHLASVAHPWLAARQPGGPATLDSALLVSLLALRSREDAAAATDTFLRTFLELLTNLIGGSLTERLLRTVLGPPDTPTNSASVQDPKP